MSSFIQVPKEIIKNIGSTIPFLRHFKEKHSHQRTNVISNIERFFEVFAQMLKRCEGDLDIEGKVILELGPGNSLAIGLLFLAYGAKKVYLVDRYKHLFWDEQDIDNHERIIKKIEEMELPFASRAISAMDFARNRNFTDFDQERLEYRFGNDVTLPFDDGSIDCIFSNAVLEHVHNVEKKISEMARITRNGGISIHEVDLRDHFFKQEPLRLLQYPDWLWNLMSWNRPGYTNRVQFPDYICFFEQEGFTIEKSEVIKKYEEDVNKLKLNNIFHDYSPEEISILAFWLMVKKTDS